MPRRFDFLMIECIPVKICMCGVICFCFFFVLLLYLFILVASTFCFCLCLRYVMHQSKGNRIVYFQRSRSIKAF